MKKKAVIFDIDGTLAIKSSDRDIFEFEKVYKDLENKAVCDVFKLYLFSNRYTIIVFTGREETCKKETEKWLNDRNLSFDILKMRPEGNREKDSIIKERMYDSIKYKYEIEAVYEDRKQCVDMWRSLGLTCFQVDEGDF